jgi:acyl-CoA synthetase (AMP-forming)/AMP-acid ligase II
MGNVQNLLDGAADAAQDGIRISHTGYLLVRAAKIAPDNGVHYYAGIDGGEFRIQKYPELLEESLCLLGALRDIGVEPGRAVAVLAERSEDFIPVFWACLLGGFPVCLLAPIKDDPRRWATQLSHVVHLLDGPVLIATEQLRDDLPTVDGLASVGIEDLKRMAADITAESVSPHHCEPTDVAILPLTSASTGAAKAVELTHANLVASMAAKAEMQAFTADDVTFSCFSFDHVTASLETHMLSVSVGANELSIATEEVVPKPLRFLQLVSDYRVTMTVAPNFVLGLINKTLDLLPAPPSYDLSHMRHILTGGEANPLSTAVGFLDRLATCGLHRGALMPTFGMTETCAGSIYNREFPQADHGAEFAAVGRPVTGLKIRIARGEEGESLVGHDTVGEVQLHGPMVTRGYRNNPTATRAAFTSDGWFRTGDLGQLIDGRLTLVGRSKDCIIVNGVNHFSHDIENALRDIDGISNSFVAAFATRNGRSDTEQLVIAFAATPDAASDDAALYRTLVAIRDAVMLHCEFRPALILPLPQAAFPKTSLGKIQRSLMRRRLESGEYAKHESAVREMVIYVDRSENDE